jgi:hypothetical protein
MQVFLFQPEVYAVRYGCVNVSVDAISLDRRRQTINGWMTIGLYCVFEVFDSVVFNRF